MSSTAAMNGHTLDEVDAMIADFERAVNAMPRRKPGPRMAVTASVAPVRAARRQPARRPLTAKER